MRERFVMSGPADDLMWDGGTLPQIRREIQVIRTQPDMHRYFPLLVCEQRRSPYRRGVVVLEQHHLDGTSVRYSPPRHIRENGENVLPNVPTFD